MLLQTVADRLRRKTVNGTIRLLPEQGRQRALLFDLGAVTSEVAVEDGGWALEVKIDEREFRRFLKRANLHSDVLEKASATLPTRLVTQR